MGDVLRIIDANANRAREALRMMEEAARFLLDHASLSEQCKQARHDLASALAELPALALHRDTPRDVGTQIALSSEQSRNSAGDVVIAAGRRLSEALRAIEEYSKIINPNIAQQVEQLRYRGYELERQLCQLLPADRSTQWQVCVLLTEALCAHQTWQAVAEEIVDAGADCVQLREKSLDDRELLKRAQWLREVTRGRSAMIVNDRADIALLCAADGVHLGQDDLSIADVRRIAGRQLLAGVSTHDPREAEAAVRAGADYCGVGAMFNSALKPEREPGGIAYLQMYLAKFPHVPHLAIGGIDPGNVHQLVAAGCRGVAVSSAVLGSQHPAEVVRAIRAAFTQSQQQGRSGAHEVPSQADAAG